MGEMHPADQLAHCNRYLQLIGDPPITEALISEISDVLSIPPRIVACFAKYGRLTGFVPAAVRTYMAKAATSGPRFFTTARRTA